MRQSDQRGDKVMTKQILECSINGKSETVLVDPRDTLLDLLRTHLRLTGTKEGCSNGNCGSCTVLVDGQTVCACLMFANETAGHEITTIEGVATQNKLHLVQQALITFGGTQCGFCTPGIIMSAIALFQENPAPSEADIRHAIAGNICRCTGYEKIIEALMNVASEMETVA